jgi:hypothetical protein
VINASGSTNGHMPGVGYALERAVEDCRKINSRLAFFGLAPPARRAGRAGSTSTGFWFVDESLLNFVGVAGEGIVGLEHREPARIVSE